MDPREKEPETIVSLLAGNNSPGFANGSHRSAAFNHPRSLVIDPTSGDLYLIDTGNSAVRKVTQKGVVTSIIPSTITPNQSESVQEQKLLKTPSGIALDLPAEGSPTTIYISEYHSHRIVKAPITGVAPTEEKNVSLFAGGNGITFGSTDGASTAAQFHYPKYITTQRTKEGNFMYVSDYGNRKIRKISLPQGDVVTIKEIEAKEDDNVKTAANKISNYPCDIYVDTQGVIYIADSGSHQIKKFSNNTLTVLAGDGVAGHIDGIATKARFHYPSGITMDENTGTLYISDTYNHSIRKISAKGEVSTIAGTGNKGYSEGSKAQFSSPTGIVYFRDALYVSDSGNHAVRKIVFPREKLTSQLVEDMTKLFGMSEIADFSVYVEEKIYRLHKSVVYARCAKLLEAEGTKLSVISKDGLSIAIKFMYTDIVALETLQLNMLFELLWFGETYQLKRLSLLVQHHVLQMLNNTTIFDILGTMETYKNFVPKTLTDLVAMYLITQLNAFGEKESAKLGQISPLAQQIISGNIPLKGAPPPLPNPDPTLAKDLANLFEQQNVQYSDFTVLLSSVVDDKKVILRLHKTIVGVRSPYFANLFKTHNSNSWQHQTKMTVDVFRSFLKFIYSSNIFLLNPTESAWAIAEGSQYFPTADNYLVKFCEEKTLTEINFTNCVELFQLASQLSLPEVKTEALRTITMNQRALEGKLRLLPETAKQELKDVQLQLESQMEAQAKSSGNTTSEE